MEEETQEWLNDIGLREFASKFEDLGIQVIDDLFLLEDFHLTEMGLTRYVSESVPYIFPFIFRMQMLSKEAEKIFFC